MSHDLFDAANPATDSYNASQIEVLEGLEPVRRRPGMYIGGTDERALHHLAAEVIDNSMDEAVAGHATRIEISLDVGNRLTVVDGRVLALVHTPLDVIGGLIAASVGAGWYLTALPAKSRAKKTI